VNRIRVRRRTLDALLRVQRHEDHHDLLFREALEPYCAAVKCAGAPQGGRLESRPTRSEAKPSEGGLGSVLAIGAGWREAQALVRWPFERIVLSGVAEPDARVQEVSARDPRVVYELANAEALPYATRSFDLVLCKEALHHLARPVLGLYEMLRVCRQRAVLIEPWDCALLGVFDRLGLTTRIERGQVANLAARDNHVYRFGRRSLDALLASYYLDSGARCDVRVGWLSTRVLMPRSAPLRRTLAAAGWAASLLPGAAGNLATVAIEPGSDLPPDPRPLHS
jgi:SAM-dependent methyltransferase